MKNEKPIDLKEAPIAVKTFSVGMSEKSFLIALNCDEDNTPEHAFTIPIDNLKDVIMVLFQSGVRYQQEFGKEIGFGMEEK